MSDWLRISDRGLTGSVCGKDGDVLRTVFLNAQVMDVLHSKLSKHISSNKPKVNTVLGEWKELGKKPMSIS